MRGGDCHDESRFDCSGPPSFGKELAWCQILIRSQAWQKCLVRCLACPKPCNWLRWEPSVFWRWSSRWSFSGRRSRENKKGIVPQFGDWDGALFLLFNWSKALSMMTTWAWRCAGVRPFYLRLYYSWAWIANQESWFGFSISVYL